jgi:tripartite-type tricarboxylate transporter receptor subunit TctC
MRGDRKGKGILITVAVLMMLWLTAVVNADAKEVFPVKPISIIVPFAPGGSVDVPARTLAVYMGPYLKTSIIISTVTGAGGAIGYTKGYTAKPDGYTLLIWNTLPPLLEEYKREVGYKTVDFTAVAGVARDFTIYCRSS